MRTKTKTSLIKESLRALKARESFESKRQPKKEMDWVIKLSLEAWQSSKRLRDNAQAMLHFPKRSNTPSFASYYWDLMAQAVKQLPGGGVKVGPWSFITKKSHILKSEDLEA